MGAEKSIPRGFAAGQQWATDNYVPMGGARLGSELTPGSTLSKAMVSCTAVHNAKILKTPSQAIWSLVLPNGESPCSRTSHWSVFEPVKNRLYIGYGLSEEGAPLNDIWGFDFALQRWARLPTSGQEISPRSGTKAALMSHYIVLFGGYFQDTYVADFHIIDIDTFEISRPMINGAAPSPRTAPMVVVHEDKVFIWGGYNGTWPTALHILDTTNLQWSESPVDCSGRTAFQTIQQNNKVFIFGGAQVINAGVMTFDCESHEMAIISTFGVEVNTRLMNASMVACGPFFIQIGGRSDSEFTFVYGYHVERNSWFLFHVVPDGETVTAADGEVSDVGLFKLPRTVSISLVYQEKDRTVYGFLGSPHSTPPSIIKLAVGDSISFVNIQDDLIDMLKLSLNKA